MWHYGPACHQRSVPQSRERKHTRDAKIKIQLIPCNSESARTIRRNHISKSIIYGSFFLIVFFSCCIYIYLYWSLHIGKLSLQIPTMHQYFSWAHAKEGLGPVKSICSWTAGRMAKKLYYIQIFFVFLQIVTTNKDNENEKQKQWERKTVFK